MMWTVRIRWRELSNSFICLSLGLHKSSGAVKEAVKEAVKNPFIILIFYSLFFLVLNEYLRRSLRNFVHNEPRLRSIPHLFGNLFII